MYRCKKVIIPISNLDDEFHQKMIASFNNRKPVYVSLDDKEPLMVSVIGHYHVHGELHGHYQFVPVKKKNKIQHRPSFFVDFDYHDKMMISVGLAILSISVWMQML